MLARASEIPLWCHHDFCKTGITFFHHLPFPIAWNKRRNLPNLDQVSPRQSSRATTSPPMKRKTIEFLVFELSCSNRQKNKFRAQLKVWLQGFLKHMLVWNIRALYFFKHNRPNSPRGTCHDEKIGNWKEKWTVEINQVLWDVSNFLSKQYVNQG